MSTVGIGGVPTHRLESSGAGRSALSRLLGALGLAGLAWLSICAFVVAVVLMALGSRPQPPSFEMYRPSRTALADVPARYVEIYRRTGNEQGLDWAILAAIGKVETDHGRSRLPGVRSGVNCAGAAGPMQLGIGSGNHGCGDAGNAWATYGTDGNQDGLRDVYDPEDAVPAAANYLRAAGAPADYRGAIFAYNHASWYVSEVLGWAKRYRGASVNQAPEAQRVTFDGRWLARVPGTNVRCDARIVDDVSYILRRFGLDATACFAASGHRLHGEHPLGLAIDAVPADGDWDRTLDAARFFGWSPSCAATGCAGAVRAPMRVLLYNGYPGHGDPAHCPPPACAPHLHLSWLHGPSEPLTPAPWVERLAR
ncbi:MAG: hypothetical protein V7607_3487 [Solirubrobacteraceae bacterium]